MLTRKQIESAGFAFIGQGQGSTLAYSKHIASWNKTLYLSVDDEPNSPTSYHNHSLLTWDDPTKTWRPKTTSHIAHEDADMDWLNNTLATLDKNAKASVPAADEFHAAMMTSGYAFELQDDLSIKRYTKSETFKLNGKLVKVNVRIEAASQGTSRVVNFIGDGTNIYRMKLGARFKADKVIQKAKQLCDEYFGMCRAAQLLAAMPAKVTDGRGFMGGAPYVYCYNARMGMNADQCDDKDMYIGRWNIEYRLKTKTYTVHASSRNHNKMTARKAFEIALHAEALLRAALLRFNVPLAGADKEAKPCPSK